MYEMHCENVQVTNETLRHLGEEKIIYMKGSAFEETIKELWLENTRISAVEAGKLAGCTHTTAGKILKKLKKEKSGSPSPTGESEHVQKESA